MKHALDPILQELSSLSDKVDDLSGRMDDLNDKVDDLDTSDLVERLGGNFARGHKEASGGIVNTAEFEELCVLMKVGEKPEKAEGQSPKKNLEKSPQKNTLNNYFKKS